MAGSLKRLYTFSFPQGFSDQELYAPTSLTLQYAAIDSVKTRKGRCPQTANGRCPQTPPTSLTLQYAAIDSVKTRKGRCPQTANAMLRVDDGELVPHILDRLDAAVAKAFDDEIYTDEINR